ncbi:MAG: Hint domain-containing protein, partial [Shimia sp.]
ASALHLILQVTRLPDGRRVITSLTEVQGMEGDIILLQDVFKYEVSDGQGGSDSALVEVTVPCFTPGARIATPSGPRAVEDLRRGDRVQTRDAGWQVLDWVGARTLSEAELAAQPDLRPVKIPAGALGGGRPLRDLTVSPQHRMLWTGALAELHTGEREVLIPAHHLCALPGVSRGGTRPVTYVHVMCARHEVILSEGLWSESFQPAAPVVEGLAEAARTELLALFPDMVAGPAFPAARTTVAGFEAGAILGG